jgi:hypothetical protein
LFQVIVILQQLSASTTLIYLLSMQTAQFCNVFFAVRFILKFHFLLSEGQPLKAPVPPTPTPHKQVRARCGVVKRELCCIDGS